MWDKMLESLQGVPQPAPAKARAAVTPITKHRDEVRDRSTQGAQERDDAVLASLAISGKLTTAQAKEACSDKMTEGMVEMALMRLRKRGKIRLVDAKPYWEIVE